MPIFSSVDGGHENLEVYKKTPQKYMRSMSRNGPYGAP